MWKKFKQVNNYYQRPEEWFIDRIGKRIYRKKLDCPCKDCQETQVDILDKEHAQYVYTVHNEMGIQYYDRQLLENKGEDNMGFMPENKFVILVYWIYMKVDDLMNEWRRKRQYKRYLKYKKKESKKSLKSIKKGLEQAKQGKVKELDFDSLDYKMED